MFASDYARFEEAKRIAALIPPEVRSVMHLAMLVLLSPLLLFVGWYVLRTVTQDAIAQDNVWWLIGGGSAVAAIAATQLAWRSTWAIFLRKAILGTALAATAAASVGYVYLGLTSYANAQASAPERTFELARRCGRHCVATIHQRADGSTLEGSDLSPPLQEARSCATVQRLAGEYGFTWVRVIERSRAPARGQLTWPISREECFSDAPLQSLPR